MEYTKYIENLENKLKRHFDIEKEYTYKEMKIDLFGKYYLRNEKYLATKKIPIYAFENNEYCIIKYFKDLDKEKVQTFIKHLKFAVDDFVKPHSEHMSTFITGVIIVDKEFDKEIVKLIQKFKFQKSFAFGFKGWVDIRLILVHLPKGEVITNKKGKEVREVYQL
ncbi:hypothetical protein FQB35_12920 [Crassaminicella thermophila]|uniref:DUF8052 domain-containing protein n=1 Tax=Crassaminicella thermophila TaxID=2599308 RepID=A0A5C0SHE1_CRATE|nr:hypothetical protein [Crassaminicella thermophila]QEK13146.1 hypothetical protein FQB35_12920 [Crassaminicella thermophila]